MTKSAYQDTPRVTSDEHRDDLRALLADVAFGVSIVAESRVHAAGYLLAELERERRDGGVRDVAELIKKHPKRLGLSR